MKTKTKAWISAGLLVLTMIVNAMGAFGWINDMSQKEVSDMYPTLITPSPSTFSIWSVIYTLLIISIIVMLIRYNDSYYEEAIEEISYLFWLSCFLNSIWIITFSYLLIGLSTLFVFTFLIVMVLIVKKVGRIEKRRRWLLPITFGLYSGWLFIATVVNISTWLVSIDWDGFGIAEEAWAVIILLVAVGLTGFVLFSTENAIFPLPIAWAYFGIYNKLNSPEGYQGDYTLLQYTALAGIVLLIGMAAIQFYKNKYKIMPQRLNEKDASLN